MARLLAFSNNMRKGFVPHTYVVVVKTVAKAMVVADTAEQAADIARRRVELGDAAFTEPEILDVTEVEIG